MAKNGFLLLFINGVLAWWLIDGNGSCNCAVVVINFVFRASY